MNNAEQQLEDLCKQVATKAHEGQERRDGTPYITHPAAVAQSLPHWPHRCIAWLHDTLEDTQTTAQDLMGAGIPHDIIYIVTMLTHDTPIDYDQYIKHMARSPDAVQVKIADMVHNLSCDPKAATVARYHVALQYFASRHSRVPYEVDWDKVLIGWHRGELLRELSEANDALYAERELHGNT